MEANCCVVSSPTERPIKQETEGNLSTAVCKEGIVPQLSLQIKTIAPSDNMIVKDWSRGTQLSRTQIPDPQELWNNYMFVILSN